MDPDTAAACKMDVALRLSKSEYILFLDADDFYGPAYVGAMVNAMHSRNLDYAQPEQITRVEIDANGGAANVGPSPHCRADC